MAPQDRIARLFLTVGEAAETLRVDAATIYRAIREDAFPVVRLRGRYLIPARAVESMAEAAVETGGCFDVADFARQQRAHRVHGAAVGDFR